MIFKNPKNKRVATIRKVVDKLGDVTTHVTHGSGHPEITYYESSSLADNAIHCFKKLRISRGYDLIEDQCALPFAC